MSQLALVPKTACQYNLTDLLLHTHVDASIQLIIGVTGELLYWIMWEAVRRLEECDLKVLEIDIRAVVQ